MTWHAAVSPAFRTPVGELNPSAVVSSALDRLCQEIHTLFVQTALASRKSGYFIAKCLDFFEEMTWMVHLPRLSHGNTGSLSSSLGVSIDAFCA